MYIMNNDEKLFSDELTNWLIYQAWFKKWQCQISIYYKYSPYGSKLVVLSYVDKCVYWYLSEELGKWFMDTFGNISHVNLLGYAHWFIQIYYVKI